jgi:5-formyltetrahydrofolate cyclo-ligase
VSVSTPAQPLPTDSKATWRRWAKRIRSQLASPSLDDGIIEALRDCELYQKSHHILSYLAFGSEMNLSSLHLDNTKTFYVTRTWDDGTLTIHPLGDDLEPHRYGFLQPPTTAPVIDLATLDLVLVPGLCFDQHGTRLGYGKGHYDRLLATLPENVTRVGISARDLIVDLLPREPFDIPMTHLATEAGVKQVQVARNSFA